MTRPHAVHEQALGADGTLRAEVARDVEDAAALSGFARVPALDVTVQAEILDLLRGLVRDEGMALWLITHDLAVVAQAGSGTEAVAAALSALDPAGLARRRAAVAAIVADVLNGIVASNRPASVRLVQGSHIVVPRLFEVLRMRMVKAIEKQGGRLRA